MTSYYDVLGVGVDADLEEVRRAYYRKAQLLHPDRYAGSQPTRSPFRRTGVVLAVTFVLVASIVASVIAAVVSQPDDRPARWSRQAALHGEDLAGRVASDEVTEELEGVAAAEEAEGAPPLVPEDER